jgi:hypothetical protein
MLKATTPVPLLLLNFMFGMEVPSKVQLALVVSQRLQSLQKRSAINAQ